MSITRRHLGTAIATTALLVAGAGAASAAPGATQFNGSVPPFTIGTTGTLRWTPATFDADSISARYQIEQDDLSGLDDADLYVDGSLVTRALTLLNGHQYRFRVRAMDRTCIAYAGPVCIGWTPFYATGPWSPYVQTRTDDTAPDGSVTINGGAAYTNSRAVTLALTYSDPPSNGYGASGVSGVQITQGTTFPCSLLLIGGDTSGCPSPVAPSMPLTLDEGPDGPRTVRVMYRDNARPMTPLFLFLGVQGNASPERSDGIVLDRLAPTARVTQSAATVPVNAPVSLGAGTSTDGIGGPADSGVDPAGYSWDLGDGRTLTGPNVSATYPTAGAHTGALTIRDRAGNTATAPFTVTVTAPASTGGGTVAGSGTTAPAGVATRITALRRLTRPVAGRDLKVRIATSQPSTVVATLLRRTASGGLARVAMATVVGTPRGATLTIRPRRAGAHVLRLTGLGLRSSMEFRVAAR